MTNTNQLIEELRVKMLLDFDQRPETQRAIALDFLRKALSQTEQECDKRWVDRIIKLKEEQKSVAPADEIEKIDERAYCAALDDLLNNK